MNVGTEKEGKEKEGSVMKGWARGGGREVKRQREMLEGLSKIIEREL